MIHASDDQAPENGNAANTPQSSQRVVEVEPPGAPHVHPEAPAAQVGAVQEKFLASMWHDLRSPLNAILGWAETLKPGESSAADITEGLEVIVRNARAQAKLIENQLDMSRLIAGQLHLDVSDLDPAVSIRDAVDALQVSAQAKGIRLEVCADPALLTVSGDPDRIQQMIWNLLSNAIKFTPQGGGIRIAMRRVNNNVEISVTDSGPGIGAESLPDLFDRFNPHTGSVKAHQHGLGLAIVRHLAELHGGAVRVESRGAGQGSSFIISLPLATAIAKVAS